MGLVVPRLSHLVDTENHPRDRGQELAGWSRWHWSRGPSSLANRNTGPGPPQGDRLRTLHQGANAGGTDGKPQDSPTKTKRQGPAPMRAFVVSMIRFRRTIEATF